MKKHMLTQAAALLLAAVVFAALAKVMSTSLNFPIGGDWRIIRQAALDIQAGRSPYTGEFYSPPFVAITLLPLAWLPWQAGSLVIFAGNLLAFMLAYQRSGIRPLFTAPLLWLSLNSAIFGNIEGMVALGFTLPPALGLFFALAKPQIGVGMAAFWAAEAWRAGGWRGVLRTFAPVTAALILSFSFYGWWPASNPANESWNGSIFPWGVPAGLGLLAYAILKRRPGGAIAAGVLCAPYVNQFMSWAFLWIGLAAILSDRKRELNQSGPRL
jgi:hypothetical protein